MLRSSRRRARSLFVDNVVIDRQRTQFSSSPLRKQGSPGRPHWIFGNMGWHCWFSGSLLRRGISLCGRRGGSWKISVWEGELWGVTHRNDAWYSHAALSAARTASASRKNQAPPFTGQNSDQPLICRWSDSIGWQVTSFRWLAKGGSGRFFKTILPGTLRPIEILFALLPRLPLPNSGPRI